MTFSGENILQTFFGASTLYDVSAEQLKHITEEHPYFGAGHFLLAKKLYDTKQPAYEQALQKAAFHFSNELWMHFNLNVEKEEIKPTNKIIAQTGEATGDVKNIIAEETVVIEPHEIFAGEEEAVEDITEDVIINDKLSNMLQEQAAAFEKPVMDSVEIPVEITPYHRVDYFDSQGIKLEEGNSNDKLGTQLKRFTDWLKQMKRINPNPSELGNDEAGEHKAQAIAAHSNEAEEIVTETMAEVLIKQGKPEQAIKIYQKLSFNNPSKSAYFAAKIEELKG